LHTCSKPSASVHGAVCIAGLNTAVKRAMSSAITGPTRRSSFRAKAANFLMQIALRPRSLAQIAFANCV